MGTSDHLEPYLVALFPLWSAGVGMEKFDVLEETTDEKNKYKRSDVCVVFYLTIKTQYCPKKIVDLIRLLELTHCPFIHKRFNKLNYETADPLFLSATNFLLQFGTTPKS
jgi:hypothetical protein